jgi:hypothetical protein
MKINIYQMRAEECSHSLLFREYSFVAEQNGGVIPAALYDLVYSGEVKAETLENVYTIFNINHPRGYRGRSLTTSDVVEVISSEVEAGFYYCDTFGFARTQFDKALCGGLGDE